MKIFSILTGLSVFVTLPASAECSNSVTPSCSVYKTCFARYCPCADNKDEYFVNYGEKYCKTFLQKESLSDAGKKWRDSTLRCLQEKIVPRLDIAENPVCNCQQMKDFAFSSHVACYTAPQASICDLPIADVNEIRKTIDVKDAFTSEGWVQMREVAKICSTLAPADGRRTIWNALNLILSTR